MTTETSVSEVRRTMSEEKRTPLWPKESTKHLLDLIAAYHERLGTPTLKTKTKMWKHIALQMLNYGMEYTATQVESKFRAMIRQYKKVMLNNPYNGTIPFQSELEALIDIYEKFDNSSVQDQQDEDPLDTSDCETEEPKSKKMRLSVQDKCAQMLQQIKESHEQQHKQFLAYLKEKEAKKEERSMRIENLLQHILEKLT